MNRLEFASRILHEIVFATKFNVKNAVPHDQLTQAVLQSIPKCHLKTFDDETFEAWDREIHTESYLRSLTASVKDGKIEHHRNGWTLTPAGLQEAVLTWDQHRGQNVTTSWLKMTLTPEMMSLIKHHVGQRCPRSVVFGEITDLVDNYFVKVMTRDGFKTYLSEGKIPVISQLKLWAYRASLTQFRDEGRDALTRSFKGAKTERDLTDNPITILDSAQANQAVFLTDGGDGMDMMVSDGGSMDSLVDIVDSFAQNPEESYQTKDNMDMLIRAISKKKKRNADRFARIMAEMTSDISSQHLAADEDISINRAATLRGEVKASLKEIVQDGNVIRQILQYVEDEPCSTEQEIIQAIPSAHKALWGMVKSGLLTRQAGSCLIITTKGSNLLDQNPSLMNSVVLYGSV